MLSWCRQQEHSSSAQHVAAAKKQQFVESAACAAMGFQTGFANLLFAAFAQLSSSRESSLFFQVSRQLRRVISRKVVTVFCKCVIIFLLHCNVNIIAPKTGGCALIWTVFALFPNKLWRKAGLWKLSCCFKVIPVA
ncbi:hypothetical protein O0881_23620 [Janthinobacterium sp. SUN100]|nr:hypothetical protein [Janthinobacterium sp. SUN100]